MLIVQIIMCILAIAAIIEGIFLRTLIREYRRQFLKVELLTEIIEERFSEHGKGLDNGYSR